MRSQLEAAMATVITSRAACGTYADNPQAFAASFDLDAAEVQSFVEMRDDLVSLMPGFVSKRQRSLRWNAQRTLTLLGATGRDLVGEYVDTYPATEDFREEAAAFSGFVVRRTAEMAGTTANGQLIAELARFDQLRSSAFWNAIGPLRDERPDTTPGRRKESFDADRMIRLPGSANLARFSWDLRQVGRYKPDSVGTLQRDPCELLFFHNGEANGVRVVRLRQDQADAVRYVIEHPEMATPRTACGPDSDPERVLGKLLWQGAVEWA
jgi:hypothetical protein